MSPSAQRNDRPGSPAARELMRGRHSTRLRGFNSRLNALVDWAWVIFSLAGTAAVAYTAIHMSRSSDHLVAAVFVLLTVGMAVLTVLKFAALVRRFQRPPDEP